MTTTTTWFTARQAANYVNEVRGRLSADAAEFTERGLRNWVHRRLLAPRGLDEDGLQLFALGDVAAAEKSTRARALRLVGISQAT